MALPSSGRIAMSDIWRELNSGSSDVTVIPEPTECDYYFTSRQDFDSRIEGILAENNQDLSTKTIGFSDDITNESELFVYAPEMIGLPKMIVGKNITNLMSLCSTNTSIKIVPETLLYGCPNLENFMSGFEKTNIETIPVGIFSQNPKLINLNYCFYDTYLTDISSNIFDNNPNLANVIYCFRNDYNVNTGTLPDVWNRNRFPNIDPSSVDGYAIGNEKCTNYNDVPVAYGGYVTLNIYSQGLESSKVARHLPYIRLTKIDHAGSGEDEIVFEHPERDTTDIFDKNIKMSRVEVLNYTLTVISSKLEMRLYINSILKYTNVKNVTHTIDTYNMTENIKISITDMEGGDISKPEIPGGGDLPDEVIWSSLPNNSLNTPKSISKPRVTPPKPISLGSAEFRKLAGVPTGTIKMSDFYGKSCISTHSCVFKWIPPWSDYKTYEKRVDVPDGSFVSDYTSIDFEQVKTDMGWLNRFANYDTITIYDTNGKVLSGMDEYSEIKQPIIYENRLYADPFGYEFMIEGTNIVKSDTFFSSDEFITFVDAIDIIRNAYTFWYPEDDTYLTEALHDTHREMTDEASVVLNGNINTPITFPYKFNDTKTFIMHTRINDDKIAYGSLETSETVDYGPDDNYVHYVYDISFKNSNSTPDYFAYCNYTDSPYGDVYPPTLYVNQIKEAANWIKNMKYATISVIVEGAGGYAEKIKLITATLKNISGDRAQYSISYDDWSYAYDYPTDDKYVLTFGPNGNYRKFTKAELSFHN